MLHASSNNNHLSPFQQVLNCSSIKALNIIASALFLVSFSPFQYPLLPCIHITHTHIITPPYVSVGYSLVCTRCSWSALLDLQLRYLQEEMLKLKYSVTLFCCQLSSMHQRQHMLLLNKIQSSSRWIWYSIHLVVMVHCIYCKRQLLSITLLLVCTRRKNTHTYNKQRTYQKDCYRNRRNKAMYVCTREDFDRYTHQFPIEIWPILSTVCRSRRYM